MLIVDDQEPFRRAAAAVVGVTDGFELVGSVGSGEECLAALPGLRPALVLLDIGLPGMDGIEAASRIAAMAAPPVVVLVSTHDEREFGDGLAACGAAAYVSKSEFGPAALRAAWSVAGSTTSTTPGSQVS